MIFDHQIAAIEKDLQLLRIEFDRFMIGAIRLPPEQLRFQIEKRIRKMRRTRLRSAVERFRLGTLEASFNTLSELHARRLREIESGKASRSSHLASSPKPDAAIGFQVGENPDRIAIETLYETLYGKHGRKLKADFASFEKHISKQVANVRKKTGCERVHLRVAREGDTLKLKAKPIRKKKESTE